ncbi:MAG: hypothetical protein JO372_00050 [Solirubrobacterales bacterium]|nr:hypothetical protein [Solirubrobacterales bacterium]
MPTQIIGPADSLGIEALRRCVPDYQRGLAAALNLASTEPPTRAQSRIVEDLVSELEPIPHGKAGLFCLAAALTGIALAEAGLILGKDALSDVGEVVQDLADTGRAALQGNFVNAMRSSGDVVCHALEPWHPTAAKQLGEALTGADWALMLLDHPDYWQELVSHAALKLAETPQPPAQP